MSPTQIPPKLAKILDLGTERGAGLEKLFETMASNGFQGIVKAEKEAYCEHMALPLSGHADVILTMRDRHQYLFDFKTISPTDFAKTYEPKLKHRLQVNTYMGIREIRTGFLIYENKAGCEWAGPSGRFYVEFDKQLYKETEQFCVDMLKYPANQELPEFNSTECAGSITFCWYRTICERERNETISWLEVDRRPETVKKRHLEVIQ
jgi:CRISPR/Cas system-associated exonuclease Cas4 (RecB family)